MIAGARLRKGNTISGRGAARLISDAVATESLARDYARRARGAGRS